MVTKDNGGVDTIRDTLPLTFDPCSCSSLGSAWDQPDVLLFESVRVRHVCLPGKTSGAGDKRTRCECSTLLQSDGEQETLRRRNALPSLCAPL